MQSPPTRRRIIAFWRDERFLSLVAQLVIFALIALLFYILFRNMASNLQRQGMRLGFGFINQLAGFDIAESILSFSRTSSYLRAFQVGLLNTIIVSLLGIFFATLIGVFVGVASISRNFLTNRVARVYIEILRNIPLLVLLVFWYRAVFLKLPRIRDALVFPGPIYLTNRGIAFPRGIPTETFPGLLAFLAVGFLIGAAIGIYAVWKGRQTGRTPFWYPISLLVFISTGVLGWFFLPASPLSLDYPYTAGLNIAGGMTLTPEFLALLSGLAIYTSAFIAEVVRAGIQSVSSGQVEAANALGLSGFQTLRLVIFPQALRVIIPPLTSQYLNLTKNSSLAVAIAYPDLFYVSNTILNQSGRAVEVISLVMLTYLSISLVTALFMNWYNQKVRLVER